MLRHYMPIFLIQGGPNGTISFQFYLIPRLTSMGTEMIFEKLFSVYSIESKANSDIDIPNRRFQHMFD